MAEGVASLLAGVVLLVEQWFLNTALRAACGSQAPFLGLLAVFQ